MSGLTLRKKRGKDRPAISSPQPASESTKSSSRAQNLAIPRERNAPSETSDLVKRRYSTRYNQLPDFSNLGEPPVPSLPGALKRSSRGGSPKRPSSSSQPLRVDQDALADSNLDVEQYVTKLLSNASEHEIQKFQNDVQHIKHQTEAEIQQSVYVHRNTFIKIGKEAEKIENEMGVLQDLMTELAATLGQINTTSEDNSLSTESGPGGRNLNRNSVANLETMWSTQLQQLWKTVEGSQKFLPAIPGRHIVMETGTWIELDSATWKSKRPVHVFLLNDHLLIASKKRKRPNPNDGPQQAPGQTKLVAEECWPLQEVDMIDMAAHAATAASSGAEERAIATAITIRSGGKSLTYRNGKRDDPRAKTDLMMTFRKTVEDLRKANRMMENNTPQADSLTYFATRDPASAKNTDILEGLNASKDKPDILIEVDGKQQNFRWIESQFDELDIAIALQRFEPAVEMIEKLRQIASGLKSSSVAQELVLVKARERAANLAEILYRELIHTPSFMQATKGTVSFLARLGFEDRAREKFFKARSDTLAKRLRTIMFDGNLYRYVFQISFVYFTMIKNTFNVFMASFDQFYCSAPVTWAHSHLVDFNVLLVSYLTSIDREGELWRECMDVVWEHERDILGPVQLDFRYIIGKDLEFKARLL